MSELEPTCLGDAYALAFGPRPGVQRATQTEVDELRAELDRKWGFGHIVVYDDPTPNYARDRLRGSPV